MVARLALARGERLFDGINHPSAVTVAANGLRGGLLYCGTPNSSKDFTASQYADYAAGGLWVLLCYENGTNDISGGASAGAAHARAFLADARAKRAAFTDPALAAVDEHVTAANLRLAVSYQRGFRSTLKSGGWQGPIGVYGFAEVLEAVHDAGLADFYFGAGSRSALPAYTNIWQDNTATILVGGSADDQDWMLIPLPMTVGDDVELIDKLPPVTLSDGKEYVLTLADVLTGLAQLIPGNGTPGVAQTAHPVGSYVPRVLAADKILAKVTSTDVNVQAIQGALTANQAALLAAINAHQDGTATITDMEAAFTAVLGGGFDVAITPKVPAA